jgi:hypothetical protein
VGHIFGYGNLDGSVSEATFNGPRGMAADSSGNLYLADATNHSIRKISALGVVTTLAGGTGFSGSANGTGAAAQFNSPHGIAVDSTGVVFVADSHAAQMSVNFESFDNLEKNLSMVGLSIERLPLVLQFNKRDLPDIVPDDDIRRAWGPTGLPVFMASALKGWGVLETFQEILGLTFDAVNARHGLTARFGVEREVFLSEILRVQQ